MPQALFKSGKYKPMSNHPKTGVSALLIQNKRVLLIKRGKEPFKGKWALPGGSQEFGETLYQAVVREIKEETDLTISNPKLIAINEPIIRNKDNKVIAHYVLAVFTTDEISGVTVAGDDAIDFIWASKKDLEKLDLTSGSKERIDALGKDKIT